jgi:hypothetical protein
MFARVITAQAGPQGFDSFIGLAEDQGRPATGLTPPNLETYEVAMHT